MVVVVVELEPKRNINAAVKKGPSFVRHCHLDVFWFFPSSKLEGFICRCQSVSQFVCFCFCCCCCVFCGASWAICRRRAFHAILSSSSSLFGSLLWSVAHESHRHRHRHRVKQWSVCSSCSLASHQQEQSVKSAMCSNWLTDWLSFTRLD